MFKKFIIVIVVFIVILAGLQVFGGRDFTQVELAWDKYSYNGTLSSFLDDVGIIFGGGKIKEGVFPHSRYAKHVMYRWTDEHGTVHVSERKPNVANFEVIELGELDIQVEESKQNKKDD
ncbi:DUF4124 domain-containing protein [Aliikangiella sp. IMCC44653]